MAGTDRFSPCARCSEEVNVDAVGNIMVGCLPFCDNLCRLWYFEDDLDNIEAKYDLIKARERSFAEGQIKDSKLALKEGIRKRH